jgi:hypothetical protein
MEGASIAALVLASVVAVLLARRRPGHRPAAVALVLLSVVNVARLPIAAALPPRVAPWEGASRALVYLDGALVLATAAVTPGLALWTFLRDRRRLALACVVGAWLLASVVLAALYPDVRGASLQRYYLAADLIGLAASSLALASWVRKREAPGTSQATAIGLVFLDVAILVTPFSPWRGSVFAGRYDVTQLEILVFFAAYSVAGVILWNFSVR